jgi:hypothetical protein
MHRSILSLIGALWLLALAGAAHAQTHEETLQADQTQQQYTRKGMTYLGTVFGQGVSMPEDVLQAVEAAIRKNVELKRFDYNNVDVSKFRSMDEFISALRAYVKKLAFDRAAAEAEFQTQFSAARVYQKDIDRIMKSAYFYQIVMTVYRSKPMICPLDAKTAAQYECTPGVAGIQAVVNAELTFWRADLTDEKGKGYTLLRNLRETPGKGFTPFDVQPPREPLRPNLPANASDQARKAAADAYNQQMAVFRQQMAAYQQMMPELERKTRVKAAVNAVAGGGTIFGAASLVKRLSMEMKKIPDFQLKSPVTAALSDGVEFMLGKSDGLGLDETYEVAYFDQAGKQGRSGWVKVRKIGDAQGSGEGTPSYAEKVKESRDFIGGESLLEYPLLMLDIGLHGVFEFTASSLTDPGSGDPGLYFGGGVYILYDLGPAIGWPEFYAGLEGDFLVVGELAGQSVSLIHGMFGIKKKWYVNSLVFTLGLRGGISYYSTGDDSQEDTLIGGGGDAVLGVEYYLHPRFSIYLNAAGRFFTNPLQLATSDAEPEMGAQANLGIRLGL